MTFGSACRELLSRGCTVIWDLALWEHRNPEVLTEEFIQAKEQYHINTVEWEVNDQNELVLVVRTPLRAAGRRLRIWRGV